MKHRHVNSNNYSIVEIISILERGRFADFQQLLLKIKEDPLGKIADDALKASKTCYVPQYSNLLMGFIAHARNIPLNEIGLHENKQLDFYP